MKHILCSIVALTLLISILLLILQKFDVNITINNKFQVNLTDIITPLLIISNSTFLISAILLDILYLPLF